MSILEGEERATDLKRRVIPIGSYIIATEELPKEKIDRLFPTTASSPTRRLVYY